MIRALVLLIVALAARPSVADAGWINPWYSLKSADLVVIGTIEEMRSEPRTLDDREVDVSFFQVVVREVLKGDMADALTDEFGRVSVAVRTDFQGKNWSIDVPLVLGLARSEHKPIRIPAPFRWPSHRVLLADPHTTAVRGPMATAGTGGINLGPAEPFVLGLVNQALSHPPPDT